MELENEWEQLMEQQWVLKKHCHLSLIEQASMTVEERKWWIDRVNKYYEEKRKAERDANGSVTMPSMPSMPSMPNVRR